MNGFDLSTISGLYVGSTEYTSIYKGSTLIWTKSGPTPIDYSREYLTIESLEDNNDIAFKANDSSLLRTIQVSTDKTNWTSYTSSTSGTTLTTLNTGDKLYVRGSNDYYATSSTIYNYFTSSRTFNVSGNIMSLIYGDNFVNQTTLSEIYTFCYLFRNCTLLVDISNLILPATTLTNYCYYCMFYGCTSLTTTPELPATTLTIRCYSYMFRDCTSLTTVPELPATTLADYCYYCMFRSCKSLTAAPELQATTLANNCYNSMFQNCTSLTTAPELPARILKQQCYRSMFYNCTSLTTAPELPATVLAISCYYGMFQNCTSLTTAPELLVKALFNFCYTDMFNGCTSLTTAPELPATNLKSSCYEQMFYGCTLINYVKALFTTDISSTTAYTNNWLYNVAATGTFVKSQSATWSKTGASGIPSGWTVTTI